MGNTQTAPVITQFQHNTSTKRAILFGFDYSGVNALNGPENDIQLAKSTLINTYSFPSNNIYMYTSGDLASLLKSFISSSIDGDINVIHYSGHGDYLNGTDVLVDEDMRIITSGDVTGSFSQSKGNFLFVVDACDTGYIISLPSVYDGQVGKIATDGTNTYTSEILFFSASGRTQSSYEQVQSNGTIYGDFSYAFYNYIGANPTATWLTVYNVMYVQLKSQDPIMSSNDVQLFYKTCQQFL